MPTLSSEEFTDLFHYLIMDIAHKLSEFAVRHLPENQFLKLRTRYFALRRHLQPLEKLIYGTFSTQDLRCHLEEKLSCNFDILMVHSSVNHLYPAYTGTALELVQMLIDFCRSKDITLAMPAFYFGNPQIGNVNDTFRKQPEFDLKKTPSQMGLATEIFRRYKGVIQSRHPVYRVSALGPLAENLVNGHEFSASPAGIGTPFDYMANKSDTLIISLGKSFHVLTQVHHVDDAMGENFPVPRIPIADRSAIKVTVIDGDAAIPVTLMGNGIRWYFNITKLPTLLQKGDLTTWKFHNVPLCAARADKLTNSLIDTAKKGITLYDKI